LQLRSCYLHASNITAYNIITSASGDANEATEMETQYAQCYLVWQWDICTLCVELEATFLIDSQFSRYLIHTIRPVNLDACPTHPGWILNNPTYSAWAVGSVGYKECKTVIEDIVTSELCTASVCLDKSIRKESISNLLQPHKPTKTYMLAEL